MASRIGVLITIWSLALASGASALNMSGGNNFDLVGSFDDLDGDGVATANLSLNSTGASDLGLSVGGILITHRFSLVQSPVAIDDEGLVFDVSIMNNSGADLSFNY